MADAQKFKTFRDLRDLNTGDTSISSNTGIAVNLREDTEKFEQPRLRVQPKKPTSLSKNYRKAVTTGNVHPISPERDFQKVPNSITRQALSDKFFRGKSKQVWDFLWSISRGAINPTRTVRATRSEIKERAGLGSMVTVDAAISHLQEVSLIAVNQISVGSAKGNEYEIFTPEEAMERYTSITSQTGNTSSTHNLVNLDNPVIGITRETQSIEDKDTYENPKTALKQLNNDDDKGALKVFQQLFDDISIKINGKGLQEKEKEKWAKLAELLIMELELAALNTDSISSIPSFLTEHLRRRLWKSPTASSRSKRTHKKDVVGKNSEASSASSEVGGFGSQDSYEAEPLSENQRMAVLNSMKGFLNQGKQEFVMSFKNTYTAEDWNWLIENVEIE